jgi:hypothetical protein
MDIYKCKVSGWRERSGNDADWEGSIGEAKVLIGL